MDSWNLHAYQTIYILCPERLFSRILSRKIVVHAIYAVLMQRRGCSWTASVARCIVCAVKVSLCIPRIREHYRTTDNYCSSLPLNWMTTNVHIKTGGVIAATYMICCKLNEIRHKTSTDITLIDHEFMQLSLFHSLTVTLFHSIINSVHPYCIFDNL